MLNPETLAQVVQAVSTAQRGVPQQQQGVPEIDIKTLRYPGEFSGREADWRQWCFKWEAYTALLGMEDEMTIAARSSPEALRGEQGQSAETTSRSRRLYHMLATSVAGKALIRVRACERGNGFEAWARLKEEYEPRQGGRRTGMLIGLLNPQWPSSASPVEFSIRSTIVTKHAPDKIREFLRAAAHHIDGDYKAMKRTLEHYLRSGVDYDSYGVAQGQGQQQPVPMDVGAIGKGGKDKGKGKGKEFGKDKGKSRNKGGKDKGKGKPSDGGKGSGDTGGGKPAAQRFQGYCSYCWKWGHKKIDCRQRAKNGAQVSAVDAEDAGNRDAAASGGAVAGIVSEEALGRIDTEEQYEMSWVFGVGESNSTLAIEDVLGDSGSEEHCCPPSFGEEFGMEPCTSVLRDIQGNRIKVYGLRLIPLVTTEGQKMIIPFVVCDVARPVISLGKLRRKGYNISMGDKTYIEHPNGDKIDLVLKKNTWYVKATVQCESQLVAPLMDEDMWMYADEQKEMDDSEAWQKIPMQFRAAIGGAIPEDPGRAARADEADEQPPLRFNATRDQMRARLKSLGFSGAGTKAQLWARLTSMELKKKREQRQMQMLAERAEDISAGRIPHTPVILPSPKEPTAEEIKEHNITHFPSQPWCEHCTLGRGVDRAHERTGNAAVKEPPMVQVDFMFMTSDMTMVDPAEKKDVAYVIFVGYDCGSGFPLAVAVTEQTPTKYLVSSLETFIQRLHGNAEVVVRCDNEPSLMNLVDKMAKQRTGKVQWKAHPG
eukprot:3201019-Amphidinium_carterae.1